LVTLAQNKINMHVHLKVILNNNTSKLITKAIANTVRIN